MLPSSPDPERKRRSATRIVIWVVVAGIGAYFVISGIVGVVTPG